MLPLVYAANTPKAAFERNGMGFIKNCEKCFVTERLNGSYELEAVCARRSDTREIVPHMFLKSLPNPSDDAQIFEVYKVINDDSLCTIMAQHIRYIMFNNVIGEAITDTTGRTPAGWWAYASDLFACDNYWAFTSDIMTTGVVTAAKDRPIRIGDFLQGTQGSMLDVFGGDFKYNNFSAQLLSRRGVDTGIAVRYGSNISSHSQELDGSAVYTHFLPYAYVKAQTEGTGENLAEMAVYHDVIDLNSSRLTYQRALSYDFSEHFTDDTLTIPSGGGAPTNYNSLVNKLDSLASAYITRNRAQLTDSSVNITIDVDEGLRGLQGCRLGDTVLVEVDGMSEPLRARVITMQYDVLNEKITKLELGTVKKTLADLISGKNIGGV